MKYQVRKGCWETNSSSMHSLVMTKKNENVRMTKQEIRDEFYLDADWNKNKPNILILDSYDSNFGRSPFNVLTSFRDKLSYAIASICGNNYTIKSYIMADEKFNEIFVPLLKRLVGVDDVTYRTTGRQFIVYSGESADYFETAEEVPYTNLIYVNKDERDDSLIQNMYKPVDKDGREIEEAWYDINDYGSIDHQSSNLLQSFLKKYNMSLEYYLVRKDIVVVVDGDEYCIFDNLIGSGLVNRGSIVLRFPSYGEVYG